MNAHAAIATAKRPGPAKQIQPHQVLDMVAERITAMQPLDLEGLAYRAGVSAREACRLSIGFTISASDYFKLCAALGFDPMSGNAVPARRIGNLDHSLLGAGMHMRRLLRKETVRAAACAARLSYSAVFRVEQGRATSIRTVLRACAYIGVHPFDYAADVSRGSTETTKCLQEKGN